MLLSACLIYAVGLNREFILMAKFSRSTVPHPLAPQFGPTIVVSTLGACAVIGGVSSVVAVQHYTLARNKGSLSILSLKRTK